LASNGWELQAEKLHRRSTGTETVPPYLTLVEINKYSNGTQSIPTEKSEKLVALLGAKLPRPLGRAMSDSDFGYHKAENMRLLCETFCMSMEPRTCCHTHSIKIGDYRLSQSMGIE